MDFALDAEQIDLAISVRSWMATHHDLAALRKFAETEPLPRSTRLWKAAVDLGWMGVAVPECLGGSDASLLDGSVVVSALGHGLAPDFVGQAMKACEILKVCGDAEQQREWIVPVMSGDLMPALALTDLRGAFDRSGLPLVLNKDGRLVGDVGVVEFGAEADVLIVVANGPVGVGAYVVDTADPGVTMRRAEPSDLSVRAAHVQMTGARASLLRRSHPDMLQRAVRRVTVLAAADLAGVAGRALEDTAEFLRVRHQFGSPVGAFQAAQHELAELYVDVITLRHGVWYAAHALEVDSPDAALMTSVVKAHGSGLAKRLAEATIQWHGALGFTWEHDAHLIFKRLYRVAYDYGDEAAHQELVTAAAIEAAASR